MTPITPERLAEIEAEAEGFRERSEQAERERDEALSALSRLLNAVDTCMDGRGAFSCSEQHDCRCPKSRASSASEWKGDWVCQCGAEELSAAMCKARERTDKEGAES